MNDASEERGRLDVIVASNTIYVVTLVGDAPVLQQVVSTFRAG